MTQEQINRLMELQKLYEEGLLNQNDLANEKAKILGVKSQNKSVVSDKTEIENSQDINRQTDTIIQDSPQSANYGVNDVDQSSHNDLKSVFQKFKIPLFIVLGLCLLVGLFFLVTRNKDKFSGDKAQVEQGGEELSSIKDYEDKFERLWIIGKTRDYTPADLQGWSKDDLKILRNYFFARNNYYFAPADLRNYFSKYSWYKPLYKEAGDWFSDLEINNVQYIKKLEGLSNYYQER